MNDAPLMHHETNIEGSPISQPDAAPRAASKPHPRTMARRRGRGRRQGSCGVWFKRNWVLLSFIGLAVAGVVLSVLLFFEPCEKETETTYETANVTVNVSIPFNFTQNVTTNVTTEITVEETVETLVNHTFDVVYNVSYNVTNNVTQNVTINTTTVTNATVVQPYQSTFVLDCSLSVSTSSWVEQVDAMVAPRPAA